MSDLHTPSHNLSQVETEYGKIVLNEATGAYWHLNETASRVLSVLQQGGTTDEAAAYLVEAYGIDDHLATTDVLAIRRQLEEMGAL